MKTWFIEGYFESSRSLQRVRLDPLPFTIGRTSQSDLMLDSPGISRNHARFFIDGGDLYVEDAGSTNGSYLNRDRLAQAHKVQAGDIVHFAETECRVVEGKDSDANDSMGQTRVGISTLSSALPQGTREFQQMLLRQLVTAHFQPIVYADGGLCAYEILGRGTHEDLPDSPGLLFRIAESLDLEVPFSELLRSTGLTLAASQGVDVPYFFNIHPAEMRDTNRLMRTLQDFRSRNPELKAVLEIHEGAVTDLTQMREVRQQLNSLDIQLAYDDFGAGQARLLELAEVPPDYVKFDMALIRDIDMASDAQKSMVKMLVQFSQELSIKVLAEGISREEEAHVCQDLGFDLFQGFYFGKPEPINTP